MGVRLYDPTIGRFWSVDPVRGGSATAYDYANADPVNSFDLDGRSPWSWLKKKAKSAIRFTKKHWRAMAKIAVGAACVVATAGGCLIASMAVVAAEAADDRFNRYLSWGRRPEMPRWAVS